MSSSKFEADAMKGLHAKEKHIPSKYLYDSRGSSLFQKIMEQPEYYLTAAERDIFSTQAADIVSNITPIKNTSFQILELGAGNASKTEVLLDEIERRSVKVMYRPVDIDGQVLSQLTQRMSSKYTNIKINPLEGLNDQALASLPDHTPNVILFLGSNIGNYPKVEGQALLDRIADAMNVGDLLLMGADRKKDPNTIQAAYNDKAGVTAAFNKNILRRINSELDGDISLDAFEFFAYYNIKASAVHSFLISREDQTFTIGTDRSPIHLKAWEYIQIEVSRKFSLEDLKEMGETVGLSISEYWTDSNSLFYEVLYEKK